MIDMSKYLKGSYITVESLGTDVRIEAIADAVDGKFDKPDLIFESGDRLGLNGTNRRTMFKHYGLESNDWIGKKVKVYVGELTFNGKQQDSVLLTPVSPPTVKRNAKPKEKGDEDEVHRPLQVGDEKVDDEIPF
jgi:hypothetical protein